MAKKIISDIIVSNKKSIRQIPITRELKKKLEKEREIETEMREEMHLPKARREASWQRKPLNPKFVIWLIAVICIMALFFGVSLIFSNATVIVTPRTEKISFANDTYTAKLNSNNSAEISFEILKVKQTAGEVVKATEEKQVSQKATGKIIIYNNYSTAPQRLINNTRFEAKNGKIYRINSSVIVPGYKKVSGKVVPGSIEATIFADQPGDTYNMKVADLTGDFKIPGFKGDLRYDGFYGRLKDDISGGYIGMQRIVSDDLRATTKDALQTKLKEQLLKELYAVKPENYLIFNDGYSIDYTNLPDTAVGSDQAQINIEGNLNGIVFNNSKIAKYLASKKLTAYDGLPVDLAISDDLTVSLSSKDNGPLWKNSTLDIKLNGEAVIKWVYDANMLRKDLAGKRESDIRNIVAKYQDSIKGLEVIFKPVWTRYFPDSLNKIRIQELDL